MSYTDRVESYTVKELTLGGAHMEDDSTKIHVWIDDPAIVVPLRRKAEAERRSLTGMVKLAVKEWLERNYK